jgi:hypothetical protein
MRRRGGFTLIFDRWDGRARLEIMLRRRGFLRQGIGALAAVFAGKPVNVGSPCHRCGAAGAAPFLCTGGQIYIPYGEPGCGFSAMLCHNCVRSRFRGEWDAPTWPHDPGSVAPFSTALVMKRKAMRRECEGALSEERISSTLKAAEFRSKQRDETARRVYANLGLPRRS